MQDTSSGNEKTNETFQNNNNNCEKEEDEIDDDFADFQETPFENSSDLEQQVSETADLDLPSLKNSSTPTDNQSEDLDLSKDYSDKVDNSGDDEKTEDDLEDEFDNFADFLTHPSEVDAKFVEDSTSDDFGAFESENAVTSSDNDFAAFQPTDASDNDGGGWAAFSSEPSPPQDKGDDDDEFGDFGDFSGETEMVTNITKKPVKEKSSTVSTTCIYYISF